MIICHKRVEKFFWEWFYIWEQTLLRFEWRTLSKMEDVRCPRVEMCLHDVSSPRRGEREEHLHGKGFSDHFLHHEIWLQKIEPVFGWLLYITLVWDWRRRSNSCEMGRVLRKVNRIVFILFLERISFSLMLKRITLVGRILKNLKHRSESFCFARDWRRGDCIL